MAAQPSGGRSKDYDHLVKLLLIGDSGVGKSCLLLRFSEDSFTSSFITTIGIDFKIKKVLLDGQSVKLQIWDTAGQERFRTITASYYRGAMGILLVYDVGDERSFASVRGWMKAIDANAVDGVVRALVGNKADVPDSQRAVSTEQGAALAREFGVPFFETSAKSGDGVDDAFSAVAREVVKRMVEGGGGWPPGSGGGGGGGGAGGGAGGGGGLRLGRGGSGGRRAKSSCCS